MFFPAPTSSSPCILPCSPPPLSTHHGFPAADKQHVVPGSSPSSPPLNLCSLASAAHCTKYPSSSPLSPPFPSPLPFLASLSPLRPSFPLPSTVLSSAPTPLSLQLLTLNSPHVLSHAFLPRCFIFLAGVISRKKGLQNSSPLAAKKGPHSP